MTALAFKVRLVGIHEHHRTIRGGKDSLGQPFTEEVNMGWYFHLELPDGEPFGVAIGVGTEKPDGFRIGDILTITMERDNDY